MWCEPTCYLRDIDRDYDEFNHARTAFYNDLNLDPLPASTGVQARLSPARTACRDRSHRHVSNEETMLVIVDNDFSMREIIDQAAIKINLPIIKRAVSNQKLLNEAYADSDSK